AEGSTTLAEPIEHGDGERRRDIELVLQSRVTVRGRIVDVETREPIAGLSVNLWDSNRRSNNDDKRHITDADGRFELDNVPIGSITLDIWNRTAGSESRYERVQQPLKVAAEPLVQDIGELEIVAKRLGADEDPGDLGYRINDWDPTVAPEEWQPIVASVRADGPAAASGLAAGDVIEKVDGIAVAGSYSSYDTLTRVPVGRTVKLALAGGKTVEIVAGPRP
ncbi:MAG TPA: PDZ domain-containing protein, partial [Enhygromyxa sp.]|nr:PDZ domain-containing protein [Enhygromyxa sp.]